MKKTYNMKSRIKELRLSKGISLTHMAEELGYKSASGYHNLENNPKRINLFQALHISKILGCKIENLIKDEKPTLKNFTKRYIIVRKVEE